MSDLDRVLAQARDVEPPVGLMGRVLEDALEVQPVAPRRTAPSFWEQVLGVLGGWQGMGGLVAATCAGLWIGISPPDGLPAGLTQLLGTEMSVLEQDQSLGGFGWDLEEG